MSKVLAWFEVDTNRAIVYRVAVALVAILGTTGVLAKGDVALVSSILAAVLGTGTAGLASKHTPRKKPNA